MTPVESRLQAPSAGPFHPPAALDPRVAGMRVDTPDYEEATARVLGWARSGESRYVCVANVHMVMEAHDSVGFHDVVERADMVTPDGMPLVWALRSLGMEHASRVRGMELALRVMEQAAREKLPVGLYGGTPEVLDELNGVLKTRFPGIEVACKISPPFRPLTPEEDAGVTEEISASGTRILFVGLGCPKQERWMAAHRDRLPVVMLGVGAVFDFLSGRVRQAPSWMQEVGMEWLFRLLMDPGRLWRRYAKHNPRFVGLLLLQLLGSHFHQGSRSG